MRKRWICFSVLVLLTFVLLGLFARPAAAQTTHLYWAERLVVNITPAYNEYNGSPTVITWAGYGGAVRYRNRSYCATFVTGVLRHTYGLSQEDLEDWFGVSSPNAATYHDTILDEEGFTRIMSVEDVRAGDILAIRYPPPSGDSPSGHIAIVRSAPRRRAPAQPYVLGTSQYEVAIVDSSSTPHGSTDTRVSWDGSTDTGVGFGVMRLYADAAFNIVGHTWSTSPTSAYHSATSRSVVVGRLE